MRIGPTLENRIACSAFAGFTGEFAINLFCEAFKLEFQQGNLSEVHTLGFVPVSNDSREGDILIPRDAFVRLVLGYRQLDELRDAWPDIVVKRESRYLLHVLFPKMTSCFCMPWRYFGLLST